MKKRIDLHLHTTRSDGAFSPSEVLEMVRNRKLAAFAIVDHDTLAGYFETKEMLHDGDPDLVAGVEFSCSSGKKDLHILGYLFDTDSMVLTSALSKFHKQRNKRGHVIVERLNELGVDITFEDVEKCAAGAPLGRPHVAAVMHAMKAVNTYEQAFEKYIGDNKPAYVPKDNHTPEQAIELIHKTGGVAVLAHPVVNNTYEQIEELAGLGLDGLEVYHPNHRQSDVNRFKEMAHRFQLLCTGGSDFHGRGGNHGAVGSEPVPVECLDKLRQRAIQIRGTI